MCRYGGVQSDDVTEHCMTSLANYIGNVRQAGHGSYVDILHMVLPFDAMTREMYTRLLRHVQYKHYPEISYTPGVPGLLSNTVFLENC